ncbi:glutamate receptor 2-like isoform X1 [Haliotis rufescens]|uniref:glutamate receptor 2-like isoform X1 n=1 Tax=Haliotis rufescens TaxID=6454 RepID=UPI00201F825F|nr:glutamate receptor 2-like isoform X1 [Haliotis rufescens]
MALSPNLTMSTPSAPTYTVTTVPSQPYVIMKEGGGYEGFVVDVLEKIASKLRFRYDIRPSADGLYGSRDSRGVWNGMVGELQRQEADIAASDLTITPEREAAVDFTGSYLNQYLRLLVKKPEHTPEGLGLMVEPFSTELWFLILVAFFVVSFLFIVIGRFDPYEWSQVPPGRDPRGARHSFGLRDSLMFVFSTLTWQGYRESPRSMSGRILAVFWFIFVLIAIVAYIANMTAFLLVRQEKLPSMPFRDVNDLLADGEVNVGVTRGGNSFRTLRTSPVQLYQRLADYIDSRQTFVDSTEEGVRRVRSSAGEYAMFMESATASFFATYNCDVMVYGANHFPTGLGLATRKGSRLGQQVNQALLELRESGELTALHRKWWDTRRCGDPDANAQFKKQRDAPLTVFKLFPRDLSVAFLLLLVGAILAVIFLIVDVVVSKMRTTKFAPGAGQPRRVEDRITGERFTADGSDLKTRTDDTADGARGQP